MFSVVPQLLLQRCFNRVNEVPMSLWPALPSLPIGEGVTTAFTDLTEEK